MTAEKVFTIKNYPDDVYTAVGKIIRLSQEWERDFKRLAAMLEVGIDKIEKRSLNKLNEALKKEKKFSGKEFSDLQSVIDKRNDINHTFFLEEFGKDYESYDDRIAQLERVLNETWFLICEATDVICNRIDALNGGTVMRPTVFD